MNRKWLKILFITISVLVLFWIWFYNKVNIQPPEIANTIALQGQRIQFGNNFYTLNNNWLKKNKGGLWEMYVEGSAFERGVAIGKLSKELIRKQEDAFVEQIFKIVPSKTYLHFLKYFIAWFNRNLNTYVIEEYKQEIYGVSFAFSDDYNYIGTKYQRILNYHAAHDIGHALQDKRLVVGCTSFAAWGNETTDHSLLIGRNFDFYVGDKFAEDKIVCFYNPDKGHKFMMVTWGGMTGAVSGMNTKGLTVTINAAKSKIPSSAATPISLVAREVLQYAGNIHEAYEIIRKRQTFVSETFMIGSAADHISVLVEKTPFETGVYATKANHLVCSNHYQSQTLRLDERNIQNLERSTSSYRYQRMEELISKNIPVNSERAAAILRNQLGLNEKNIGMGNEKAINQLIAHHSIVFQPESLRVWVSTNPFQLGQYVCYDLNNFFNTSAGLKANIPVDIDSSRISADIFLESTGYRDFLKFKSLQEQIKLAVNSKGKIKISSDILRNFIQSNPEYHDGYKLVGDYFKVNQDYKNALVFYETALTKEVATLDEKEEISKAIAEMKSKQ